MTCEGCGADTTKKVYLDGRGLCPVCYEGLTLGDWRQDVSAATFRDDIPGGMVCENYGPKPIRFDSHSERRAYMAAHGLQELEKFCPMPGTDKDPQGIPNPKGYVDPQTLRNGMELVLRAHNSSHEREFDGVQDGVIINQSEGHLTERDAAAIASGDPQRQSRLFRRMNRAD